MNMDPVKQAQAYREEEQTKPLIEPSQKAISSSGNVPDESIIFGYLALPHLVIGVTDSVWDFVTFLLGYDIDYNNLEYVTGLATAPEVDNSAASMRSLNFHALVSCIGILLLGFQVVSGTIISQNKKKVKPQKKASRKSHRWMGPLAALFWMVANLSGIYYLFASQRIADKQTEWQVSEKVIHRFYHCLVGTAGLANLGIGILAIFQQDYVLHHGAMYFAFYWGNFVGLFKFVRSLVQCADGGGMDIRTYTLIAAVTLSIETPLYAALGYRYGGQAYRRPFVTYNLMCFAFLIGSAWMALLLHSSR